MRYGLNALKPSFRIFRERKKLLETKKKGTARRANNASIDHLKVGDRVSKGLVWREMTANAKMNFHKSIRGYCFFTKVHGLSGDLIRL